MYVFARLLSSSSVPSSSSSCFKNHFGSGVANRFCLFVKFSPFEIYQAKGKKSDQRVRERESEMDRGKAF